MKYLVPFLIAVFMPIFALAEKSKVIEIPYKESKISVGQTKFRCTPLLTASIWANTMTNYVGDKKVPIIEGAISEGTTTLFMKLSNDGKSLGVNTNTSIAYGFDDYKWTVLVNDEKNLIGIWLYPPGRIDTLSLNKEKGIAVMTRNDANYFISDAPLGDVYYTLCK